MKDKRFIVAIVTIVALILKEMFSLEMDIESMIASIATVITYIVTESFLECTKCKVENKNVSDTSLSEKGIV